MLPDGPLRASLGAVLGASLATVAHACRVQAASDHLVAEARQVLDAAPTDQDDRVLLQVVPLAGDVGPDLHLVRQAHAGDLAQSRVRLLRRGRVDARADAALLRRTAERRGLGLGLAAFRPFLTSWLTVGMCSFERWLHTTTVGGAAGPANRTANRSEDRPGAANGTWNRRSRLEFRRPSCHVHLRFCGDDDCHCG